MCLRPWALPRSSPARPSASVWAMPPPSTTSHAFWRLGPTSRRTGRPSAARARWLRGRDAKQQPEHGQIRAQGQSTMPAVQQTIDQVRRIDVDQYKYGFETDIESVKAPKGLDESTVAFISRKKGEPAWMLEWRLEAFRRWKTMTEPVWANVRYPKIDFQDLYYYAAPKSSEGPKSL